RLLPALFLVTTAIAVWAAFAAKADRLATIRADGVATLLYVANWRFILVKASYFDQFGDPSPFRHTWSLAIEEQYYLVFPLLLVALLTWSRRRHWLLPTAIGALAAASVLEMALLYQPGVDTSRIYFGTDTRIHELLIGSLLGVLATAWRTRAQGRRRLVSARVASVVAAPGLIAVLAAMTLLTDQSAFLYLGGFAVVCLATAALILGIEDGPTGPVGQLLSLPPVAWVGMVSYGLYLWHWPIFIALSPERTGLDGSRLVLLRFAVTFAAAAASFYLVERPIRRGAMTRVPALLGRGLVSLTLPMTLAVLLFGTAAATAPELPDSPFGPGYVGSGDSSILIVGDSVGTSLAEAFPGAAFPTWRLSDATQIGCGLAAQYLVFGTTKGIRNTDCDNQVAHWQAALKGSDPDVVLLSSGAWEVFDHVVDDKIERVGTAEYADYLLAQYDQAYDVLTSTGARLVVPSVPCYAQTDNAMRGAEMAQARNDGDRVAFVNSVIGRFSIQHPDVVVIDIGPWVCPGGTSREEIDGVTVRYDGVHYTEEGGAALWSQVLMPAINRTIAAPDADALRALLVGDSVPLGLSKSYSAADHPGLVIGDSTKLGCSTFAVPSLIDGQLQPMDEECATWEQGIAAAIDRFQPDVGVVFIGIGEQFDKEIGGEVVPYGSDEQAAWLAESIKTRIDLFRDRKLPVVVVTSACHNIPVSDDPAQAAIVNDDARTVANNAILQDVARSYRKGVTVFDLHAQLCSAGFEPEIDGVDLYDDGLHFSEDGAALVWDRLAPVLFDAAGVEQPSAAATD
ncbi:MAG: acyltransferase, partial [Nocardioidaceae bacterium]|nr:acyltransferase [Nocardioidaceae bacterium]